MSGCYHYEDCPRLYGQAQSCTCWPVASSTINGDHNTRSRQTVIPRPFNQSFAGFAGLSSTMQPSQAQICYTNSAYQPQQSHPHASYSLTPSSHRPAFRPSPVDPNTTTDPAYNPSPPEHFYRPQPGTPALHPDTMGSRPFTASSSLGHYRDAPQQEAPFNALYSVGPDCRTRVHRSPARHPLTQRRGNGSVRGTRGRDPTVVEYMVSDAAAGTSGQMRGEVEAAYGTEDSPRTD